MTNVETTDTTAVGAAQAGNVTPKKASPQKGATRKKAALTGRKTAKAANPKKAANPRKRGAQPKSKARTPRAESKGAKILSLIRRAKGATPAEIMKATGWQAHSVRGFISTAAKKYGIRIESVKNEKGERVYRAK
jgi:hypothetical protein